jgi:hypothetical protein
MTLIGPAVVIRVGPARDDGERNADASKEARSEFHCIFDHTRLIHVRWAVNERSIMNRKRRSLRRSMTLGQDTESQMATRSSRIAAFVRKLKAPFTRQFWEDRFESSDDETLVDSKVLSYAYLEVGMIEAFAS